MLLKMFSIRDQKAQIYYPPFFKTSQGEAERDFTQLANDDKSTVQKFPQDFDLYYVGEYDDSTGKFQPTDTPQHLAKAIDLKTQKPLDQ